MGFPNLMTESFSGMIIKLLLYFYAFERASLILFSLDVRCFDSVERLLLSGGY